jgi:hypothetical protein
MERFRPLQNKPPSAIGTASRLTILPESPDAGRADERGARREGAWSAQVHLYLLRPPESQFRRDRLEGLGGLNRCGWESGSGVQTWPPCAQ